MQTIEGHMYARIHDGALVWLFTQSDLPEFNEDDLQVVDITHVVPQPQVGWSYDGAVFSPPTVSAALRAAEIAARRFRAETAGITVNGMALPTDRDSQALGTGAVLAAANAPSFTSQ